MLVVPHPRTTLLCPSWILPKFQQCGTTRSQEGGAARSPECEVIQCPMGRRAGGGTSQVHRKVGKWLPLQSYTTQSLTSPESAQTSIEQPRQLTSQHGASSAGWGYRKCRAWNNSFPQVDAICRGMFHPRKMVIHVWESDLAQVSWQLSKPQTAFSLLETLVCFTLSFQEPMLRGCK